ncbi:MAG: DUF2247 family protein [Clostridia bacterium]|nr:DUF2247 family protein [Clostridia bacterium]
MYKINIDTPFIDWNILYYGIENDIIAPENAIDYAYVYLENKHNEDTPNIIDLLILENPSKNNVLDLLKLIKQNNTPDSFCKRILRYLVLDYARNNSSNTNALLEFAEQVYADFDYPEDMNSFIAYMPVTDDYNPSKHTEEENLNRLIHNFDMFMTDEFLWIKENQKNENN